MQLSRWVEAGAWCLKRASTDAVRRGLDNAVVNMNLMRILRKALSCGKSVN